MSYRIFRYLGLGKKSWLFLEIGGERIQATVYHGAVGEYKQISESYENVLPKIFSSQTLEKELIELLQKIRNLPSYAMVTFAGSRVLSRQISLPPVIPKARAKQIIALELEHSLPLSQLIWDFSFSPQNQSAWITAVHKDVVEIAYRLLASFKIKVAEINTFPDYMLQRCTLPAFPATLVETTPKETHTLFIDGTTFTYRSFYHLSASLSDLLNNSSPPYYLIQGTEASAELLSHVWHRPVHPCPPTKKKSQKKNAFLPEIFKQERESKQLQCFQAVIVFTLTFACAWPLVSKWNYLKVLEKNVAQESQQQTGFNQQMALLKQVAKEAETYKSEQAIQGKRRAWSEFTSYLASTLPPAIWLTEIRSDAPSSLEMKGVWIDSNHPKVKSNLKYFDFHSWVSTLQTSGHFKEVALNNITPLSDSPCQTFSVRLVLP